MRTLRGLIALIVLGITALVVYIQTTKPAVPEFEQFKIDYRIQNSLLNFHWVPFENFSPATLKIFALQYPYFGHRANSLSSTITSSFCNLHLLFFQPRRRELERSDALMQNISGNLVCFYKLPVSSRTPAPFMQLFRFCALSQNLENTWSKEQIIETYFNTQFYGVGLYGIGSASQVLFEKTPNQLNLIEASILSASTHSPTSFAALPADQAAQMVCSLMHRINLPEADQLCTALPQIIETSFQRGWQHLQQLREQRNTS